MNPRPSGYEPDELPGCSTPRLGTAYIGFLIQPRNRKFYLSRNQSTTPHEVLPNGVVVGAPKRWATFVTSLRDTLTPAVHSSYMGPSVHHLNHSVLAAALVAEIQSVRLAVLDQKHLLTGTSKSANGNTDYL